MQIKPYEKNAKEHPKKQIEQVANSIKEFGMNQPIVVDKQGVIIVGHGRYEALKHLGMENTEIELTEQFREEAISACMSIGLTEDEADYEVDEYYGY